MVVLDIRQVATDVSPGQMWYCNNTPYRVSAVYATHVFMTFADVADVRPLAYMKRIPRSEFFEWFRSEPKDRDV